jgi:hypothetical protein
MFTSKRPTRCIEHRCASIFESAPVEISGDRFKGLSTWKAWIRDIELCGQDITVNAARNIIGRVLTPRPRGVVTLSITKQNSNLNAPRVIQMNWTNTSLEDISKANCG